ncbi:MAG: NAD(+) synthase [Verrucomicrobia bacterium]|nr:NAD(+) synthase [Cytophagales bacterium]
MKLLKVAAAVLNQTPLDWEANKNHILQAIEQAKTENVSILCLPEMCITGYGCEDALYSHNTTDVALQMLQEIVPFTEGIIVSVGLPVRYLNRVFNTACLISDGEIYGFVAKKFLAGDGIHYEPRWFSPWQSGEQGEIEVNGEFYPIGDLFFDISGIRIGFEICEDAWVASRPGRDLYRNAVDIILNPSASHFAFGKNEVRKRFVVEGSRAFGTTYVYANLLGNEAGRAIYDGSMLIASGGQILATGRRFFFGDFDVLAAVIDIDKTRLQQTQTKAPFFSNGDEKGSEGVFIDFDFPVIKPEIYDFNEFETWENSPFIKEEEFTRAVSLSLFDYLRKSRSFGWVISLSGGADSSAITALCYLAIKSALQSIGLASVKKKLSYIPNIDKCETLEDFAHALISCVYQSTENSSENTRFSAESLAKSLNVSYFEINISQLVETYTTLIEGGIGRELSWKTDDVPLQNIQARVRAPSIWLLANLKNALLLSTSNRSEAAVGYATMDGDTSGSISPIAGIDKAYLRKWLLWAENEGVNGEWKISGLDAVNNLQPTAELRPLAMTQTDEEDLMPYEVLDAIERCAIRDKQNPSECLLMMQAQFGKIYTTEQLKLWTERFFKLWCRNQWKRERYAPSFHLDDENLDPKTWCRFPILSGGFVKELEEMKKM